MGGRSYADRHITRRSIPENSTSATPCRVGVVSRHRPSSSSCIDFRPVSSPLLPRHSNRATELEQRCLCPPVTVAQTPMTPPVGGRGGIFGRSRRSHCYTTAAAAARDATAGRRRVRAPNERRQRFARRRRAVAKAPSAGNSNSPKYAPPPLS